MTNDMRFKFYSILKNEDAMPYIGRNFLVAADGLGGAGSTIHRINREKYHINRENIFSDISFEHSVLSTYIDELIEPMLDEVDDTSALWASRIVMGRVVYALSEGDFKEANLEDEEVRKNLTDYISKGLNDVANRFNLQNGEYSGQHLLPTTLALIHFKEEDEYVEAESIWAGDSRLYALTLEGLKILSIDDEDASGAITNLFYAHNEKTHLNYLKHKINKPCILMAVSDGVFDPFDPHDHLGVEYTLLSIIRESNSLEEVKDNLYNFFQAVRGDDATMAFVSFGFTSFEDIKEKFQLRTEEISITWEKQREFYDTLQVMNQSKEEAYHYVTSRTRDMYNKIVNTYLSNLDLEDEKSWGKIPPTMKETISDLAKKKITYKKEREDAIDELANDVRKHPQKSDTYFKDSKIIDVKKLHEIADNDVGAVRIKHGKKLLNEKRKIIQKLIDEKVDYYLKKSREYRDNNKDVNDRCDRKAMREHMDKMFTAWQQIDRKLYNLDGRWVEYINKFEGDDRELVQKISETVKDWKGEMGICLNKSLENICKYLKNNPDKIDELLTEEAIKKYHFDIFTEDYITNQKEECRKVITSALIERKEEVIPDIVEYLAEKEDKQATIIDGLYNATKLQSCRTYHKFKNLDKMELKQHEMKLKSLENGYISLVTK